MHAVTESITKNRQPAEVLAAMVERAFGADQVPTGTGWATELGQGWFNVVYLIRLRDGRRVVLKIAPPAHVEVLTYERDMMRNELTAMAVVGERSEVPVPAVYCHDASRQLCDAEYFFMEYVDADNLGAVQDRLTAEETAAYDEAVGAANRALHRVRGTHFGPLAGPIPGRTGWRAVFTGLVEDILRDGERRSVDLGQPYPLIRELLAAHAETLDQVTEPVFVEWDLWPANVMVADGAVVSVIDHERALYADPLMEAGFVAIELPRFGAAEGFVRGYGWGPSTRDEWRRRRLYNLYLMLVMVVETVYRGHTDPAQYHWARAGLAEAVASFDARR
ncbi:aminoglycoside phosphotransferase family protein [Streptomyces sp. DSM 44915]|uniref:Aminoglycoside phosphotransferase family protein n=1 Tax=Streptomyces chisholmiae TaxID=3075540 RepID=A0ABU2JYU9_9ACTN|nr:aminoglycoside phosphotransferase family protein [Streptomyces sp. DSM 44915]MDT0270180.1 aminoglycoside phosphotransferase family protein [Streptomyces sp. DSM 44915]